MRTRRRIEYLCLGLALLLLAPSALAQEGAEKGDTAASLYGTTVVTSDGANGVLGGRIGFYPTSSMEIGANAGLQFSTGAADDVSGQLGPYILYHFGQSRTRPYVGGTFLFFVEEPSNWYAMGQGGLEHYLNRNASFFVEADWGLSRFGGETEALKGVILAFGFKTVF